MTSTHEFQSVEVHSICALQGNILTTLIWTAMFLSIKSREMISTVTSTPMISQTPCYFFPFSCCACPLSFWISLFLCPISKSITNVHPIANHSPSSILYPFKSLHTFQNASFHLPRYICKERTTSVKSLTSTVFVVKH